MMNSVTRHFGLKKAVSRFLLAFDSHPCPWEQVLLKNIKLSSSFPYVTYSITLVINSGMSTPMRIVMKQKPAQSEMSPMVLYMYILFLHSVKKQVQLYFSCTAVSSEDSSATLDETAVQLKCS